ncbi:hypothetical protein H2248_012627 [Termitomyces sp. 'cryptogamus']|nr:hypothetical protein H2248_012627 [Termitomyces sp. 'cryptogamus']
MCHSDFRLSVPMGILYIYLLVIGATCDGGIAYDDRGAAAFQVAFGSLIAFASPSDPIRSLFALVDLSLALLAWTLVLICFIQSSSACIRLKLLIDTKVLWNSSWFRNDYTMPTLTAARIV